MTKPTGRPDQRSGETRKLRDLETQVAGMQKAYQRACETIAEMHAAAVGEVRAPVRGVVQDVQDARAAWGDEIDHLATLVSAISHERSRITRQMVEQEAAYEARIDRLIRAMHDAGVEDDHFPQGERTEALAPEAPTETVAAEG